MQSVNCKGESEMKKTILDLIRTDLITMNGGKNSMRSLAVLTILFFGGLGFAFSPLFGLFVPIMTGGFFVPMMFQNEQKYHSEKMYALLPIGRADLVKSRFILSMGLYVIVCVIFYLLMLLSMKLKLNYFLFGDDAEQMDVIGIIVHNSGGAMTEQGVFNLLFFSAFSFGLMIMSGNLRSYFKDSERFSAKLSFGNMKKSEKKEYVYALIVFAVIILFVLIVSGILPLRAAVSVIMQLCIQLAGAANGFLLGAVLVTTAVFSVICKYICTVLEYDEKEL